MFRRRGCLHAVRGSSARASLSSAATGSTLTRVCFAVDHAILPDSLVRVLSVLVCPLNLIGVRFACSVTVAELVPRILLCPGKKNQLRNQVRFLPHFAAVFAALFAADFPILIF